MSTTKKMKAGIPVVDSSGTVTPVTVAELARQIGEQLGVQRKKLGIIDASAEAGWYRIAKFENYYTSGIMSLNHYWSSAAPAGVIFTFSCAPENQSSKTSIVQIGGVSANFEKVRLTFETTGYYLELYAKKGVKAVLDIVSQSNYPLDFYAEPEKITGSPEVVNELTFSYLRGGGKYLPFNRLRFVREAGRRAA